MGLLFIDRGRDSCQGIRRDHTPNCTRANATEDENAFKHYERSEQFATIDQVELAFHLLPEHDGRTIFTLFKIAWFDEVAGADLACVPISREEGPDIGTC